MSSLIPHNFLFASTLLLSFLTLFLFGLKGSMTSRLVTSRQLFSRQFSSAFGVKRNEWIRSAGVGYKCGRTLKTKLIINVSKLIKFPWTCNFKVLRTNDERRCIDLIFVSFIFFSISCRV
jgi:hypothetical protein